MKNKFIYLVIALVVLIMIAWKCNWFGHSKPAPDHSADKKQVEQLQKDLEKERERLTDSIYVIKLENDSIATINERLTNDRAELISQIATARKSGRIIIKKVNGRDSLYWYDCNELALQFSDYIDKTSQEQQLCDSLLINKDKQIEYKDSQIEISDALTKHCSDVIGAMDELYDRLSIDYKKIRKGRNQIYVGLNGMANVNQPVFLGASAMLKTRKNMCYEVGGMYGSNSQLYYFGSLKILISFKKK